MKTTHEAEQVDGVVVCKHEIEILYKFSGEVATNHPCEIYL